MLFFIFYDFFAEFGKKSGKRTHQPCCYFYGKKSGMRGASNGFFFEIL